MSSRVRCLPRHRISSTRSSPAPIATTTRANQSYGRHNAARGNSVPVSDYDGLAYVSTVALSNSNTTNGSALVTPHVVPGFDHIRRTRREVLLGAVIVTHAQAARSDSANVASTAAVRLHDRLDRLRPPPARLRRHAHRLCRPEIDHLDACLVRRTHLVRGIETLRGDTGHRNPPRRSDGSVYHREATGRHCRWRGSITRAHTPVNRAHMSIAPRRGERTHPKTVLSY